MPDITQSQDGNSGSIRGTGKPPLKPTNARLAARALPGTPSDKARTTIVEQIYFQREGDHTPFSMRSAYYLLHKEMDKPVQQELDVGEDWVNVPMQYLEGKQVGLLHVLNYSPKMVDRIPTDEQKQEEADKIIEIAVMGTDGKEIPFGLIRPNRSGYVEPLNTQSIRLRCRKGITKVTVTLFPPG